MRFIRSESVQCQVPWNSVITYFTSFYMKLEVVSGFLLFKMYRHI